MPDGTPPRKLVEVQDLKMHFPIYGGVLRRRVGEVKAVDGVSFDIHEGETLGLVGESGCGKSTCGRAVLRLYEVTDGAVRIEGENIADWSPEHLRKVRPKMQMVFQDPQASLNPRMTVASIIGEPLDEHTKQSKKAKLDRVYHLMDAVGLNRDFANRYPHEFSGGQAQRIGIARAIVTEPKLIVCDEPVSALDVSIQAQIVNLLKALKERMGLTLIFISHDLSVVRLVSDRILVLYLGRVVEIGPRREVFANPGHPYTKALLSAAPIPDPAVARARGRTVLKGDPPSPINPPSGCAFRTRCPIARDVCAEVPPPLAEVGADHRAACLFWEEVRADPAVVD